MKAQPEPRPCRQCGREFTPRHSNGAICSEACRKRRALDSARRWEVANPERRRGTAQAWRDANRDRYRAMKRDQKARNPEHYRAARRRWYHAHKDQERAAFAAWQEKNRERRTAYQHEWERRTAAIADGKASAAQGPGVFLLVRASARTGYWRAHFEGTRIGATEQIVARYAREGGRWLVRPPAFATDAQKRLAARLARSEAKRVRRFSSMTRPSGQRGRADAA